MHISNGVSWRGVWQEWCLMERSWTLHQAPFLLYHTLGRVQASMISARYRAYSMGGAVQGWQYRGAAQGGVPSSEGSRSSEGSIL